MPLVDLVGQGDGAATGAAAVQLNLALSGQGDAAATGAAGIALNLTLVGESDGAAAGPSVLGVALDLRNNPAAGHLLIALAGGTSSANATLTQPSPLGGDVALKASAHGGAQAEAQLSAAVALTGRSGGSSVTPSSLLTGVVTLAARAAGESSNRARAIRNRLFSVQAGGQASGNAGLTF